MSNNDLSFSQNMTANPTSNLTDQIFTEEKMLSQRIKNHKLFMTILTILHLCLTFLSAFFILTSDRLRETKCSIMHFSCRLLYLAMNFGMFLYFAHLARNSKIQSIDIYIFDLQIRLIRVMWLIPLLLWAAHLLAGGFCPKEPFPTGVTLFHFMHLELELIILYLYVIWYQTELKRYSGAELQSEMKFNPTGQSTTTTNSINS